MPRSRQVRPESAASTVRILVVRIKPIQRLLDPERFAFRCVAKGDRFVARQVRGTFLTWHHFCRPPPEDRAISGLAREACRGIPSRFPLPTDPGHLMDRGRRRHINDLVRPPLGLHDTQALRARFGSHIRDAS
jgi:hypothetical protein